MGGQSAEALRRLQGGVRLRFLLPVFGHRRASAHPTMGTRDDEYDYLFKGSGRTALSLSQPEGSPSGGGPCLGGACGAASSRRVPPAHRQILAAAPLTRLPGGAAGRERLEGSGQPPVQGGGCAPAGFAEPCSDVSGA